MFTDAELAMMPDDERVRVNALWSNLSTETLVSLAAMQDVAERNQNYRFDDDDDVIGGWDCD